MKNFLIILSSLLIVGLSGYFAYGYISKSSEDGSESKSNITQPNKAQENIKKISINTSTGAPTYCKFTKDNFVTEYYFYNSKALEKNVTTYDSDSTQLTSYILYLNNTVYSWNSESSTGSLISLSKSNQKGSSPFDYYKDPLSYLRTREQQKFQVSCEDMMFDESIFAVPSTINFTTPQTTSTPRPSPSIEPE